MLGNEPQNELLADITAQERKQQLRRALLISAVVLALAAGSLLAGLFLLSLSNNKNAETVEISAAGWVGEDSSFGNTHPAEAANGEDRYAPVAYKGDSLNVDPSANAGGSTDSKRGELQSGMAISTALGNLGLTATEAHKFVAALTGIYDFRKAQPGQTFEVRFDSGNGEPNYFQYNASLTEVYEVKKVSSEYVGRKKHIPTTKKLKSVGGTIATSLYKTLKDLEAHPSLSSKIADVLSNLVNFYKEQRPGDTFRVIVEEETLDEHFLGFGPVLALEYNGVKSGHKRFFFFENDKVEGTYYNEKGVSIPKSAIRIPLHYTKISSKFGLRYHPVLKRKKLHNGVDFAASTGTPVWTCLPGTVTDAGMRGANGNLVTIDHGNGLRSYYAHLHRFARGIKKGKELKNKQVIGYVGNTGRSTGPHLHFGLKKGGRFIDPLKYKVQPGKPIAHRYRKDLKKVIEAKSKLLDKIRISPATEPLAEVPEDSSEVLGLEDF